MIEECPFWDEVRTFLARIDDNNIEIPEDYKRRIDAFRAALLFLVGIEIGDVFEVEGTEDTIEVISFATPGSDSISSTFYRDDGGNNLVVYRDNRSGELKIRYKSEIIGNPKLKLISRVPK